MREFLEKVAHLLKLSPLESHLRIPTALNVVARWVRLTAKFDLFQQSAEINAEDPDPLTIEQHDPVVMVAF
jgi:hypothetical protein